jgi:outer membrane lipoprotein carrier protein
MTRRVGARIAVVLAAGLAAAPAAAQPEPAAPTAPAAQTAPALACGPEAAARVQARYEGIRSLRARFTQTTESAAFGAGEAPAAAPASGRVEFAKPGRMRFEYETPEPSLVVSDGKTLWIYDPVAKEVQVLPVEGDFLSAAAIQFLLGEGRLTESFEVTATSCAPERAELALRPRAEASYEQLDLVVDPKSGWIRETTVRDLLGNRTRVVFEGVEAGGDPDAARFRFEPPEGVRVLTLEKEPR